MSRTTIHKTTHLNLMAFVGEQIYRSDGRSIIPSEVTIQKGCKIASAVLNAAEDPDEQDYLNTVITPALLGSAWQDAFVDDFPKAPNDLMYRVVALPRLDLENETKDFALSVWLAGLVHVDAASQHQPFAYTKVRIDKQIISIMRTRHAFASLNMASLWLCATPVARKIDDGTYTYPEIIQHHVRETSYNTTKNTLILARKIGALPTIGQLNDPYSPLTVELMRSGPVHLRERYLEAVEVTTANN